MLRRMYFSFEIIPHHRNQLKTYSNGQLSKQSLILPSNFIFIIRASVPLAISRKPGTMLLPADPQFTTISMQNKTYSYNIYASNNILLVHKLKERQNRLD
jgi:hypothetical protein